MKTCTTDFVIPDCDVKAEAEADTEAEGEGQVEETSPSAHFVETLHKSIFEPDAEH